ncbi:MAG: hypothetical protein WC980_09420 [Candidatus Brocadiia bacterium]
MKKSYQILMLMTVLILSYVAFSYYQGMTEQKSYQTEMNKPIKPEVLNDKDIKALQKPDVNSRNPWTPKETTNALPGNQKQISSFKLTGVIIEPNKPSVAFIMDLATTQSGRYYENETIDQTDWRVITITEQGVTLRNSSGEELFIYVQNNWGEPAPKKPEAKISEPAPDDKGIGQVIADIMDTKMPNELLKPVIGQAIKSLGRGKIEELVQSELGIAPAELPADDGQLLEYAMRMVAVFRNQQIETAPGAEPILFAAQVNPQDNRPVKPADVFPASQGKIYACFNNKGLLQGKSRVLMRWTNQTTGKRIIVRPYGISGKDPANFIYVSPENSWQKGTYQTELFDIKTGQKIAGGTYRIE